MTTGTPPTGPRGAGTAAGAPGPTEGMGSDEQRRARLDERYGRRTPSPARRRLAVGATAVVAALGLSWVAWAATGLVAQQAVTYQEIGFSSPTPTQVTIEFQVTKAPEDTVRCDVRALADDFTTVGWRTVDLGPADEATIQQQVDIRTQQLAVSAEVMGCEVLAP